MSSRVDDRIFKTLTRSSDKHATRLLHDLVTAVLLFGPMVLSAAAVGALVALVTLVSSLGWFVWAAVAPLLYLAWLVGVLALSAATCWQIGARHPKPRQFALEPGVERDPQDMRGITLALMSYRRFVLVKALPLASLLAQLPHFDRLVLRAYSPSIHMGENVSNKLNVVDPDLTLIGSNVILGGASALVAHSLVYRGDALVYTSAPIRVGNRVTIGGGAYVALGASIGDDAIVEQGAFVAPFTQIPAGEIWGGNPARLRRVRDDIRPGGGAPRPAGPDAQVPVPDDPVATTAPSAVRPRDASAVEGSRRLVVDALGLDASQAEGELSSESCPLWDSLGQVAIAAAIFDRFGITVDGADVFQLKSVEDIERLVAGQSGGPTPAGEAAPSTTGAAPIRSQAAAEPDLALLSDDVELLPLLDPQAATRALASRDGAPRDGTPLRVNIVASFTAQQLEPTLKLWGRAFGFDIDCEFAGYDQIVQALLDRNGPIAANHGGVTVVLTRPEDLPTDSSAAKAELNQLLDAVEEAAARRAPGSRLLVGTLPPVVSSFSGVDRRQADAMREHWRGRLATMDGVELFDFSHVVERVGIENARASQLEVHTRGGYSPRLHQELAIGLVRRIRSARGRPAKVVALDCDNTLWGGVVGEVGLEALELGPDGPGRSFQLFQEYLKRLKDRGLLLVVVSRNEERDVREVFARHPGMVLQTDDIAAWRVNWEHKSENLRELADELSLGLDSFVFVDDDPATRMEVKTRVPEVHVVPLPADAAAYCETLDRLWLFDGAQATAEDATRTEKAREEQRRREEHGSAASLEEFLARLELEVELRAPGDGDWPRVAQLTQKTNQFNLSLKRRTLEEVKVLNGDADVLVLGARDRFGDYGDVGVCVLGRGGDGQWELDTLLMSCRALGRGVEDAFLHGIAARAAELGATRLLAPFVPGPRNAQVKDFLARSGFDETQPDLWSLPIADVPPLPGHVRFRDLRSGVVSAIASEPEQAAEPEPAPGLPSTSAGTSTSSVVFDQAVIALFSAASHDRNPLHLSEEYARTTPYGEPVVFGILGVLAALSQLPDDPERALVELNVEFRQTLSVGVRYRMETEREASDTHQLTIWDGRRLATKLTVKQGARSHVPLEPADLPTSARLEPIDRAPEEIDPDTAVSGSYAPAQPAFDDLLDRWDLGGKGLGREQLAALVWSSYLVGMELPGQRALFWSLDLRFSSGVPGDQAFSYAAAVTRADAQLEFVEVVAELSPRGEPWAQAKMRAFVRGEASSLASRALPALGPVSDVYRGKVAVVVGGSRGLGAAIVQALAMNGCTVLATYWKSRDDADRVVASLANAPGTVEFVQGDAGDEAWCRDVLHPRVAQHARLDILVCNAAPALRPLGLSVDELERFQDYATTSLALVAAPLAALLEPLSEQSGSCVLVSSSALGAPPVDWPHYIAAKSAAEGLIQWAATAHQDVRFLVARPPRMRTDMTNTPGGHRGAIAPEQVAAAILRRLSDPSHDRVDVLESFED